MTERTPFEGFVPTTPTEVALWNEIQRLKYMNYELGLHPSRLWGPPVPNELEVAAELPPIIKLPWCARVIGSAEPGGYLRVRVQARYGHSPEQQFGAQYMQTPHPTKFGAADLTMRLHEQLLHQVARFLCDEPKP